MWRIYERGAGEFASGLERPAREAFEAEAVLSLDADLPPLLSLRLSWICAMSCSSRLRLAA